MNSENNPNVNASATTSPSGQPKPQQPSEKRPADGDKPLTEADFLTREQVQAKAAILAVLADMKHAVAQGADLREWTRQHPLIMAGTATVAGFIAGMLATPVKNVDFQDVFWGTW